MSTFKDITISFANLLKNRARNPFYGTLILVYLIRNHQSIYQLFFIKQTTLKARLGILSELFGQGFIKELSICVGLAFLAMLISYVLTNISELLQVFFKQVVNVWVQKLIDKITNKTNTYSKEDYLKMGEEKDFFEKKFNAERDKRLLTEKERDDFEETIKKQNSDIASSRNTAMKKDDEYQKILKEKGELENELDWYKSELDKSGVINNSAPTEMSARDRELIESYKDLTEKEKERLSNVYKSIKHGYHTSTANRMIELVEKRGAISDRNKTLSQLVTMMFANDMVEKVSSDSDGNTRYDFTKQGKILGKMVMFKVEPN
ncbi:MAG: hypothetical protein N4A71_08135 [Carboxylicivirga sp.]|jgi:short subunit dehydrogenase-like uncharacterized protein|nr:hypothetical protein [Carboxylicivirga sp.]